MRTLIVFLLLLTSCSHTAPAAPAHEETFPAGPPMADYIHFNYAVYLLPGHTSNSGEVAQLVTRYKGVKLVDHVSERPSEALVSSHFLNDAQKSYTPPDIHTLQLRGVGLSKRDEQALQKSHQAVVLEFAHPKTNVWSGLRTATVLIEELARKTSGLIFDEETRQVFTPDSWHKRRLESWTQEIPQVSQQFVIDMYALGEYQREVTLGLSKAGLPDLVVQETPESTGTQAQNLINSVAQLLAEGERIPPSGKLRVDFHAMKNAATREAELKSLKANALGTACVLVKPAQKDEGDPDNRLMELSGNLYSGPDPHARLENLFSSLFGFDDSAHRIRHTDELLEESKKETARLRELQKAFLAGLAPGEYIMLKAPFKEPDGGNEWMWVEVTRWRGKTITGTLENDPTRIPDLRAGQVVQISQDDVFDYIRHYPDGRQEGNTTGEILEKLGEGPEQPLRARGEMPECD